MTHPSVQRRSCVSSSARSRLAVEVVTRARHTAPVGVGRAQWAWPDRKTTRSSPTPLYAQQTNSPCLCTVMSVIKGRGVFSQIDADEPDSVAVDCALSQCRCRNVSFVELDERPIRSLEEQDRITGRDKKIEIQHSSAETERITVPDTFLTLLDEVAVCPCGRLECRIDKKTKGMRKPTGIAPLTLAVLDLLSKHHSHSYFACLLDYVGSGAQPPTGVDFPPLLEHAVARLQPACEYLAVREAECAVLRFPCWSTLTADAKRGIDAKKVFHSKSLYALAGELVRRFKQVAPDMPETTRTKTAENVHRVVVFSFEHASAAVEYRNAVYSWYSVLVDRAPAAVASLSEEIKTTIASLPRRRAEQVAELLFFPLNDSSSAVFPAEELGQRIRNCHVGISKTELARRVAYCASREGPYGEAGVPLDPQLARLCEAHDHGGHVPPGVSAYCIVQKALWAALGRQSEAWTDSADGEPLAMRDVDGYPRRFMPPGGNLEWYDADKLGESLPHSEVATARVFREKRPTTISTVELASSARRMLQGGRNAYTTLEESARPAGRVWVGGDSTNQNKKQRPAEWARRMIKHAALLVSDKEILEVQSERPVWVFRHGIHVPPKEERTFVKWAIAFRDAHVAFGRPRTAIDFDPSSPLPTHPLAQAWPDNSAANATYFAASADGVVPIWPRLQGVCYMERRSARSGREHGPVGFKRLGAHKEEIHKLRRAITAPRTSAAARGLGMFRHIRNDSLEAPRESIPDWYADAVSEKASATFLRLVRLHSNVVEHLNRQGGELSSEALAVLKHRVLCADNFDPASKAVLDLHAKSVAIRDKTTEFVTGHFAESYSRSSISLSKIEERSMAVRTEPVTQVSNCSPAFKAHVQGVALGARNSSGPRLAKTVLEAQCRVGARPRSPYTDSSEAEEEGEEEESALPAARAEVCGPMDLVWQAIENQLGPKDPKLAGPTLLERRGTGHASVTHGILAQTDAELLEPGTAEFVSRWKQLRASEVAALKAALRESRPVEVPSDVPDQEVVALALDAAKKVWKARFSSRVRVVRTEIAASAQRWKTNGWAARTKAMFRSGALRLVLG